MDQISGAENRNSVIPGSWTMVQTLYDSYSQDFRFNFQHNKSMITRDQKRNFHQYISRQAIIKLCNAGYKIFFSKFSSYLAYVVLESIDKA